MTNKIPFVYMKDLTAIMAGLDKVSSDSEYLWVTGPISVTDGEQTYVLVSEDDSWWLDPNQTSKD